ncbi:MAG: hypothetical protein GTN67_11375 [Hydrotalea flava]|uniref:hypothetical protein n=1 Tax=Hydrotalea TaxID=1004300 RepID=UPI000942358E|nr:MULTISPECIES: hypothetical protein [Hydrotalea]NIM35953.1 hypothetical protein [Hydrotalea flava]NIM38786.1 hypothetical protein [Hydrotalea flava]NIN03974.1 hypothetical protein [Hydrotalea flava]NIN15695.1 hypothetical protein [Hydrotalea flava]NIO94712.1 hypothetical protein [Hydrotalea flava]
MKKNYIFLVVLLFCGLQVFAQTTNNRFVNIQGLKIAYITKQLNLSSEEAQQFWPVYYDYLDALKEARKNNLNNPNILALDEAILEVKKNYYNQFKQILGTDERAGKVFLCERNFRLVLKNELEKRRQNRLPNQR